MDYVNETSLGSEPKRPLEAEEQQPAAASPHPPEAEGDEILVESEELQGDLEIREDDRRGEPEESVLLKERSEPPEPPERKELVERRAPERRDRPGGRDRHGRHDGRHERSGRGENFGPHAGGQRLRPFTNDVRHHNPHEKAPKREILVNCSPEESRVAVVEDDKLIELLIERS